MFSFLFKNLLIQQQRGFRLQIKSLSSMKTDVTNIQETGIVKRFSQDKGFGFIRRDSNGNDIFVHYQSIVGSGFKTLQEGQKVEFKVSEGTKGPEARNVLVKDDISKTSGDQVKTFEPTLTNDRYIGIVRKYIKNRGYGFITRKSDGEDLFVHSRSIRRTDLASLEEGMEVEFFVVQSHRGAEAKDIRIVNKATSPREIQKRSMGIINNPSFNSKIDEYETGIVIKWNKEHGYGFVRRKLNGSDLFVHAKSLKDNGHELKVGQQIKFRIRQTEKGEEASDVDLSTCE